MVFFCFPLHGWDVKDFIRGRFEKSFFSANHRIFLQAQEEYAILNKYEFTS